MEVISQKLEDILESLGPLTVDWQDETAHRVIDRLKTFPVKMAYSKRDVQTLLDADFDDGILMCRLFLGMSKDHFVSVLRGIRNEKGIGVKSYRADRDGFIEDLLSSGLLEAMTEEANRKPHWRHVLIERLRSGRGSAIAGQRRGAGEVLKILPKKSSGKCSERISRCAAHSPAHASKWPSATLRFHRRALRAF